MSPLAVWVSQVAYTFPAASEAMSPSIHHSVRDREPWPGDSSSGRVQAVPVREVVKNSWPGCTLRVPRSVGWPTYSTSMRPVGRTTSGALYPPPSGNPGSTCVIEPHVLPPSVEVWITALKSPAAYAQLPVWMQSNLILAAEGP